MKKILMLLALFYSLTFGQGWNSTVTITSINEPNLEKMDLFTNASGNHILIKRTNGNIVYYNVNSSGTVDANKTATLETSGDFPNIVGSGDIVYALYKAGSEIHMKYSSNGGTSWTYSSLLDISIGSNACNGIDAVYENLNGVHLVWATQDNGSYFETYYNRLTPSPNHSWVENKNVTDHSSAQIGGQPSVSFSSGRVHVSFNTATSYNGDVLSRDRISGSWQTPASAVSGSEKSAYERLIVRGSTQYLFYSSSYPPYNYLRYRTRSVTGGSWSGYTAITSPLYNFGNTINVTKTNDDDIHLLYMDGDYTGLNYKYFDGSSWSSTVNLEANLNYSSGTGFSNVSNDLFVIWKKSTDNYLRYKQNDQNPLTPADFAGSVHYVQYDAHPKLTWTLNNEPDVRSNTTDGYIIERSDNYGAFSTVATLSGAVSVFIDYDIHYAGSGPSSARYRIKSRDLSDYESAWSNIVQIQYGNVDKSTASNNIVYVKPEQFYLSSNYPNPFNPSTKIKYVLQEAAKVQIKVYDILGTEVAELVNEVKPSGFYEATFDASDLSSGIYIYRITALKGERILFSESKQMILVK